MAPVIGAHATAAAAAAAAARMREEEEKLTMYNKDDLAGWEFKIVRAYTGYFRKPENLKRVCEEEAKAGWEMVEKFDDYRVRFKRPVEKRRDDQFLQGIDPYRTQAGIAGGKLAIRIIAAVLVAVGLGLAIPLFASQRHGIAAVLVAVCLGLVIALFARKR